jgi:hypothetical protein
MSLRKLCVFLLVNCIFIFRIANTFVASYAMIYSEIFFVIRKFLVYTPPTIHASYGPDCGILYVKMYVWTPCLVLVLLNVYLNVRYSSIVDYTGLWPSVLNLYVSVFSCFFVSVCSVCSNLRWRPFNE